MSKGAARLIALASFSAALVGGCNALIDLHPAYHGDSAGVGGAPTATSASMSASSATDATSTSTMMNGSASTGGSGGSGGVASGGGMSATSTSAGGAGGGGACGPGSTATLTDDFDKVTPKWTKYVDTSTTVDFIGTLDFTIQGTKGAYVGIVSMSAYSLVECSLQIELLTTPAVSGIVNYFNFEGAGNILSFTFQNGSGYAQYEVSNVLMSQTTFAYDESTPLWLRFRDHSGKVHFETSTDAINWKLIDEIASPIWISAGKVNMGLGASVATSSAAASFDKLNL